METGENRARDQGKAGCSGSYDAIVVCGGDGTIFDVIQGLAGSAVPLGIIPFGTGNVMAQNLKVPKDPVAAAHWILRSVRVRWAWAKLPAALLEGEKAGCSPWLRHGHACLPDVRSATIG